MSEQGFPRRIVFHGLGALGVAAALAGCGSGDGGGGESGANETTTGSEPSSLATTPSGGGSGGAPALATTADVPVGGGIVLTDEKIVITQPTKGEFKAFTAVCTHRGCTVNTVTDGEIHCPCHGSVYDAATGENIGGPAPAPLVEIAISVKKGKIFEA